MPRAGLGRTKPTRAGNAPPAIGRVIGTEIADGRGAEECHLWTVGASSGMGLQDSGIWPTSKTQTSMVHPGDEKRGIPGNKTPATMTKKMCGAPEPFVLARLGNRPRRSGLAPGERADRVGLTARSPTHDRGRFVGA